MVNYSFNSLLDFLLEMLRKACEANKAVDCFDHFAYGVYGYLLVF